MFPPPPDLAAEGLGYIVRRPRRSGSETPHPSEPTAIWGREPPRVSAACERAFLSITPGFFQFFAMGLSSLPRASSCFRHLRAGMLFRQSGLAQCLRILPVLPLRRKK